MLFRTSRAVPRLVGRPSAHAAWRSARGSLAPLGLRSLQTSAPSEATPDFAFVFDIDGVLSRGGVPLDGAHSTLSLLNQQKIPYVFLTNGGGVHERVRTRRLTAQLSLDLSYRTVVQSHTPFQQRDELKHGTTLVVGGSHDGCARIAESYGFVDVINPAQLFKSNPYMSPFTRGDAKGRLSARPPHPKPISKDKHSAGDKNLKIDSILVFTDSENWGLDLGVIVDCLLSKQGYFGTLSPKNGDPGLPNKGYQQDGQPALYFSNPDLWFAARYHLPRLGQGAFKAALEGIWADITGGKANGVELQAHVLGKPSHAAFAYAEDRLRERRQRLLSPTTPLKNVYMVGDNPAADIKGLMTYESDQGAVWSSALVRSGVYTGGELSVTPTTIVDNVEAAVKWALEREGWQTK